MSGCSYGSICPKCGGEMSCYSDYKPYDTVFGECLNCGFTYYTKEEQKTLEEVNERRLDAGLEPLTKLREPTPEPAAAVGG